MGILNGKTMKKTNKNQSGFTLLELMTAVIISLIVFLAVWFILADGSGWFSSNYSRINSQPAAESLTARKAFESIVRKASSQGHLVSYDGRFFEVNYYSSVSSSLDSYAQFYINGNDLMFEKGTLNPKTSVSSQKLCENVSSCVFKVKDNCAQMILKLDDGKNRHGVLTSAVMHNE